MTRQIGQPRIELDGRDRVERDAPPCSEVFESLRMRHAQINKCILVGIATYGPRLVGWRSHCLEYAPEETQLASRPVEKGVAEPVPFGVWTWDGGCACFAGDDEGLVGGAALVGFGFGGRV